MKKLLSLCLSIAMVCALVPAPALAEMADEVVELGALQEIAQDDAPMQAQGDYAGVYTDAKGVSYELEWGANGTDLTIVRITIPAGKGKVDLVIPYVVDYQNSYGGTVRGAITSVSAFNWGGEGEGRVRSVTIPNTITSITCDFIYGWPGALQGIESVVFEPADDSDPDRAGVSSLPEYFFQYDRFSSVTLPTGIKAISKSMFENCANLVSIEIPPSVETIEEGAFYNCNHLVRITFNEGLKRIDRRAFYGHGSENKPPIVTLDFPNSLESIGEEAFIDDRTIERVSFGTSLTESELTTIGDRAFRGTALTEVNIPDSVVTIGDGAFEQCRDKDINDGGHYTIQTVRLGSSQETSNLQSIGAAAFFRSQITTIALPNKLVYLGYDPDFGLDRGLPWSYEFGYNTVSAFYACKELTNIDWPTQPPANGLGLTHVGGFDNCPKLSPSVVEKLPHWITTIDCFGFGQSFRSSGEENLTIPSTITHIKDLAFGGTFDIWAEIPQLEHITFEDGLSALRIERSAFENAIRPHQTVILPKRVSYVGRDAFSVEGTYYVYNKDIQIADDGFPWRNDTTVYYPDDAAEDSSIVRHRALCEEQQRGVRFVPFAMHPDRTVKGTLPAGATARLVVNGASNAIDLADGTTFAMEVPDESRVYVVVHLEGYVDYTVWPTDDGGLSEDWEFSVAIDDLTPLSTTGNVVVKISKSCRPEAERIPAAIGCGVALFDATGRFVAGGKTPTSACFMASELPAGSYTVVAFDKNDYFSSVSSEADFVRMGVTDGTWARREVAVVANETVEVALDVPDLKIAKAAEILDAGGVAVPDARIVEGCTFTARISYDMKDGHDASKVQVSIPEGVVPVSVSTLYKSYGIAGYDPAAHVLTVNGLAAGDRQSSTLYVGLQVETPGAYTISASVASGAVAAPLGSTLVSAPDIVLGVPSDELATTSFKADVYARPDSRVFFRINDVEAVGEDAQPLVATTNKVGHATATLTIPEGELSEFSLYDVTAYTLDAAGTELASTHETVEYHMVTDACPTREMELSFVSAGTQTYLVKDGVDQGNVWYTCITKPSSHQSLYSHEWPFKSVLRSERELGDTATLLIMMLDGSLRYETMKRSGSITNSDGSVTYTYLASVAFGDGNIQHDLENKDIPFRFEVIPEYVHVEEELAPPTYTQENVDVYKKLLLRRSKSMAPSFVDQDIPTLLGTEYGLTLDADPQTGIYRFAPNSYEALKDRMDVDPYYDASTLVFNQGYKHEVWDKDGEVWNALNEADRRTVIRFEEELTNYFDRLQELYGSERPMYAYGSMEEYLQHEFGYRQSDVVPDPKELERQGYQVVYDQNAGEDEPLWYAVRMGFDDDEVQEETQAQDDELLYAESSGGPKKRPRPKFPEKVIGKDVDCIYAFHSGVHEFVYDARDFFVDHWEKVDRMALTVTWAAAKDFDNISLALVGKDLFKQVSKCASALLSVTSLPFTYDTTVKEFDEMTKMVGRKEEIDKALGVLEADLKNLKANGGGNTDCAAAIQWEMDELNRYRSTCNKCHVLSALNVGMTWEIQAIGIYTAVEGYFAAKAAAAGVGGEVAKQGALNSFLYSGKAVASVSTGWTIADIIGMDSLQREQSWRKENWALAKKARMKQCKKEKIPQHGTKVCLDPSGFVYEAVETNRLEGVTATVQYKNEKGKWVVWDAENYDQVNGVATDADGSFAWDVPQGLWRVEFKATGYGNKSGVTYSDEMEVPPERTGLAIPMVTRLAPSVESVTADDESVEVVFGQYMKTDEASMPKVTMAGARLTGASWVDPTPVSATDATEYARVLRVAVPGGTRLGSTLPVTVAGAVNYAGRSLDPAWKGDVKVAPRPAKIALDYAEAVPVQVGTTRSLRVRVLDKQDGPIAGATVTATGSNTTFAKVSGAPGKTDGLGATTIQVEALLPGTSRLTLAVAGTGLTRTVELATTLDPVEDSVAFVDVSAKTAHHEDISWLAAAGVTQGWVLVDGTREFRPYAYVARADMAAFLFRLAKRWGIVDEGWQPKGASPFVDVTEKVAHYREVMWLAESGISKGWTMGDGTVEFRPYAYVARADMAAFLARLWRLAGGETKESGAFVDVSSKTAHHEDIAWLAASGVSKGWDTPSGAEFRPLASVARADMAAFLHRLDALR